MGTLSLLQAAKLAWETSETGYDHKLFIIFQQMKYMVH